MTTLVLLFVLLLLTVGLLGDRLPAARETIIGLAEDSFTAVKSVFIKGNSQALVSVDQGKVQIAFEVADKDQLAAKNLAVKLGWGSWPKKLAVELDKENLARLSATLPARSTLSFGEDTLSLKGANPGLLKSLAIQERYELATDSGKAILEIRDEGDYILSIDNPSLLMAYATVSGKLYLSNKIIHILPTLSKVGKIEMRVSGKNIDGRLILK